MLIDIGNTNTKIKYEIVTTIESNPDLTIKDLVEKIGEFKFLGELEVKNVVISSVVPKLTDLYVKYCKEILELEPLIVSNKTSKYEITTNEEVGADVLATVNAVVGEAIIVMLGTATVISYVNDGLLLGVIIAPGVLTSIKSLIGSTALLKDFEIDAPIEVLGRNSTEGLKSGAIYGHSAMIDGLIDRINPTNEVKIIAMGGFANKIIPLCKHDIEIDNDLLFKGLIKIYEHSL
ncbi:type III pantothenate kinase [Mycoplasmatota bacterium WC44]